MSNWKKELDTKVVDIEFLLISVVQGVALSMLAASSAVPIGNLEFAYWPAILVGFLFILTFWSQAIIHALSFIDWPLDLGHTFLYFLASFVEVMAFTQIEHPLKWFMFLFVFLFIAGILYVYDLSLIKAHKKDFEDTKEKRALYEHMYTRQNRELKLYIPFALAFTGISILIIAGFPQLFIDKDYHVILSGIQAMFSLLLIKISVESFKKRSELITEWYKVESGK